MSAADLERELCGGDEQLMRHRRSLRTDEILTNADTGRWNTAVRDMAIEQPQQVDTPLERMTDTELVAVAIHDADSAVQRRAVILYGARRFAEGAASVQRVAS